MDNNKKTYLEKDLIYIQNEIIARQPKEDEDEETKYVKFSRALQAVSGINMTKKQFKNYWRQIYKNNPEELKIIYQAIDEKLKYGLISAEEMIEKIKKSKDYDSEKKAAIKALKIKEEE